MERWQEQIGRETGVKGTAFLAVISTGNSYSPCFYRLKEDGIAYDNTFIEMDLHKRHQDSLAALMSEPGMHIYRYEDGRLTDERWIPKFNVALFNNDACELLLFQEYHLSPDTEERREVLKKSIKAEKIKDTLVYACYENDTGKILSCLERASKAQLDKTWSCLGTPLGFCAEHNNPEAFIAIAEKGADIGKKSLAFTPLAWAFYSSAAEIVFYIYENHREQFDKEVSRQGFTIAHCTKDVRLLQLLLDYGCDVNCEKAQFPPLHNFVDYNNVTGIRFLLEHGADVNTKNKFGQTALERAMKNSKSKEAELLREYMEKV